MDLGWIWVDLGEWIWDGSGVDLGGIWVDLGIGSGVNLGWIWDGSGIRLLSSICPGIFIIALGNQPRTRSSGSRAVTPSGHFLDPFFYLY